MASSVNVAPGPRTPYRTVNGNLPQQQPDQNIQVFLRCRPLDTSRNERKSIVEVDKLRREVRVPERDTLRTSRTFTFDNVFDPSIGQFEVYTEVVSPLIQEVLAGYNCTVFAYGQTGTGKTYTMEGVRSDRNLSWEDDPTAGIVPRTLDSLFELLKDVPGDHSVSVSYMELYNENLYDLLSANEDLAKLNIYEDNIQKGSVKVGGLSEITVHDKEQIYEVLVKGSSKRQTAATKLNACSSRSHTIFAVTVRMKETTDVIEGEETFKVGKLYLVDLAGSENIGRSGATDKRATEAGKINQSLLTLGRVINSLVEKTSHIPYRESKLTRILQDSLGGRTKTSIIATISPSFADFEDTISTLEYAQRAKKITNKPELNLKMSKTTVLRELTLEIERMRKDLEATRGGSNTFMISRDNYDSMNEHMKQLEEKEKELLVRLRDMEEEMNRINVLFSDKTAALERTEQVLQETQQVLQETEVDLSQTKQVLTVVSQEKEEQHHLVQIHVNTEKELSSEANILLSVATTSTDHVDRLHSKVSRIKDLEQNNLSVLNNFLVDNNERVTQLQQVIDVASKDYLLHLESDLVSKLSEVHSKVADTVNDKITDVAGVLINVFTQVRGNIEKRGAAVQNTLLQGVKMNEKNVQLIGEKEKTDTDLVVGQFQLVSQQVSSFQDKVSDSQSVSHQLVQNMRSNLDGLRDSRSNFVASSLDSVSSGVDVQSKGLADLYQRLSQLNQHQLEVWRRQESAIQDKDKEMQSIQQELQQMQMAMTQLTQRMIQSQKERTLMIDFFREENELLSDEVEGIKDRLNQQMSLLPAFVEDVKKVVDTSASVMEGFETSLASLTDQMVTHVKDSNADVLDNVRSVIGNLSLSEERVNKAIKDSCSQVSNGMKEASNLVQETLESMTRNQELDQTEMMDTVSGSVSIHLDSLKQEVQWSEAALSSLIQSVPKILLPDRTRQKQQMSQMMSGVSEMREVVESLVTTGIKRDCKTGETPEKTNFLYPNKLSVTSPHERILDRFRRRRQVEQLEATTEVMKEEENEEEEEFELINPCKLDMEVEDQSRSPSCDSEVENKAIVAGDVSASGGSVSRLPRYSKNTITSDMKKSALSSADRSILSQRIQN